MNTHRSVIISLLAASLALASIGSSHAGDAPRTDPKQLVEFMLPSGWTHERMKNGRHFTRVGMPEDPNMLAVIPEPRDEYMTMVKMRDGRKRVHAAQGHRQVSEAMQSFNGFEVWEGVFEATIRGQPVVMHTYLLISDGLLVDVHLNASKGVYADYLPDLRELVRSVRALQ
ncbi:MAG: hypothetical protein R3E65_11870 [Steroidobacteraceae bacterium]